MNAAILNGVPPRRARIGDTHSLFGTMNAGPDEDNTLPEEIMQIPGGVVVQSAQTGTIDDLAGFMGKWATTGAKINELAPGVAGDFPFKEVATAMTSGAAIGAGLAGIGAAVGAVVGGLVAASGWILQQFGPGPSRWDNAGPNVHWWFTVYGPQRLLNWLDAGEITPFGSVADCAKMLVYWHLQENGKVLWYGNHATVANYADGTPINDDVYVYNAQFGMDYTESPAAWDEAFFAVEKMYDDLGIDWRATVAHYNTTGVANGIVYRKRVVLTDAGQVVGEDDPLNLQGQTTNAGVGVAIGAAALLLFTATNKR